MYTFKVFFIYFTFSQLDLQLAHFWRTQSSTTHTDAEDFNQRFQENTICICIHLYCHICNKYRYSSSTHGMVLPEYWAFLLRESGNHYPAWVSHYWNTIFILHVVRPCVKNITQHMKCNLRDNYSKHQISLIRTRSLQNWSGQTLCLLSHYTRR